MHVEFRCCYVEHACAFTPQSFYRVKERMLQESKGLEGEVGPPTIFLYDSYMLSEKRSSSYLVAKKMVEDELSYRPKFQVQFVLDQAIRFSTAPKEARGSTESAYQKRKRKKNMLHGTECFINTNIYSVSIWEAHIGSFPLRACHAAVKIRLVQLPPPLKTKHARRIVTQALSTATNDDQKIDTPLCIGVGKITLYELLALRGGIRIALQAKKGLVNIVEGLNISSTSTTSLLGEKIGGTAFLVFEVVAFTYGRASLFKLLSSCSRDAVNGKVRSASISLYESSERPGEEAVLLAGSTEAERYPLPDGSLVDTGYEGSGGANYAQNNTTESALIRFLVAPYFTAVEVMININDVLSWRRWDKTFILMVMCFMAHKMGIIPLFGLVCTLYLSAYYVFHLFYFYNQSFQYLSTTTQSPSRVGYKKGYLPSVRAAPERSERKLVEDSQVSSFFTGKTVISAPFYLYGRQNKLLNALVRSLYFNQLGETENSFYEIAFVFSLLKGRKYKILTTLAGVFLLFVLLSVEVFFLIFCVGIFIVYPITVRFTIPRSAKSRKRCLLSMNYLYRTWCLNHPLRVLQSPSTVLLTEKEQLFRREETESLPPFRAYSSYSRPLVEANPISVSRLSSLSPYGIRQLSLNTGKLTFAVLSFTSLSCGKLEGSRLLNLLLQHYESIKLLHSVSSSSPFNRRRSDNFSSDNASPSSKAASPSVTHNISGKGGKFRASSSLYEKYVQDTLDLLSCLRNQVLITVHVSTTANMNLISDSRKRLDSLIQPQWLLEPGEDDGITSTFTSTRVCPFTVAQLGKRNPSDSKPEARALAAFAAYLLQGARLSIYSRGLMNRNCSIILPLAVGSSEFVRYSPPFLKPFKNILTPLLNTLEQIWKNGGFTFPSISECLATTTADGNSGEKTPRIIKGHSALQVSEDVVLQLIRCAQMQMNDRSTKGLEPKDLTNFQKSKEEKGDQPFT